MIYERLQSGSVCAKYKHVHKSSWLLLLLLHRMTGNLKQSIMPQSFRWCARVWFIHGRYFWHILLWTSILNLWGSYFILCINCRHCCQMKCGTDFQSTSDLSFTSQMTYDYNFGEFLRLLRFYNNKSPFQTHQNFPNSIRTLNILLKIDYINLYINNNYVIIIFSS